MTQADLLSILRLQGTTLVRTRHPKRYWEYVWAFKGGQSVPAAIGNRLAQQGMIVESNGTWKLKETV